MDGVMNRHTAHTIFCGLPSSRKLGSLTLGTARKRRYRKEMGQLWRSLRNIINIPSDKDGEHVLQAAMKKIHELLGKLGHMPRHHVVDYSFVHFVPAARGRFLAHQCDRELWWAWRRRWGVVRFCGVSRACIGSGGVV